MSFLDDFKTIKDDRSNINKEYELIEIIFLSMAAVLSGAKGWKDIHLFGITKLTWLQQFCPFANGIPTHHSIGRIIRGIQAESLLALKNGLMASGGRMVRNILVLTVKSSEAHVMVRRLRHYK